MHELAKRYLRYVRASLTDATRLLPDVSDKKPPGSANTRSAQAVTISFEEIEQGKFSQHTTKHIFAIVSEASDRRRPDAASLWPIRLLICPRVYAQRPEHGKLNEQLPAKVVPVFVCARLHEDGRVSIDEGNRTPIIPREYLEPTNGAVAIGTVDEADAAYATLVQDGDTWTSLLRAAFDLVQRVTDSPLDELRIEQYERVPVGLAVLQQRDVMTFHIQRLVDLICADDARAYPLYEALITAAPQREIKTGTELLDASARHCGHMEPQYGLSLSQREALLHFLSEEPGTASILAVDGPPGTGKTTLLLSVIATLWIQAEVEERLRPTAKLEDSKSPRGLEQQYRRLAKLFPCFVSTLSTFPDRFIAWRGKDLPLFGAIDLLIVDEAGQVSPEVGVASFTLAKRALVVGDVDQIPPVWNIPRTLDSANARRYLVIEDDSQFADFIESGRSASRGSLMRMAQRATPYAKHPARGRGMFLQEHRRYWPEIIGNGAVRHPPPAPGAGGVVSHPVAGAD